MSISIQITVDGTVYPIARDVCTQHPAEVHEALGSSNESELQHGLDQCSVHDWYRDGMHLGPDVNGLEIFQSDWTSATIEEQGNGFPDVGNRIYHADSDTIYRIVSMGRTQTAQYANNCRQAIVEDTGDCASDLGDEEFEGLSDCRITLGE